MQEKELLELMLEHQDRLNSQIHPNWREQNFPWHRAIWIECSELMDCFPWKWWSETEREPDWENVQVELADILHFMLSWVLQEGFVERLWDEYEWETPFAESLDPHHIHDPEEFLLVVEKLAATAAKTANPRLSLKRAWNQFSALCGLAGLPLPALARIYFGKNVLNRFRQAHGLKEGRYRREWNGVEDNRVMLRLIEDLEVFPLERFEEELMERLEAEYAKTSNT